MDIREGKIMSEVKDLKSKLQGLQQEIIGHEIYRRIETLEHLQAFMEHHVYAVWDFMSLLKTLQQNLTCTTLPWVPKGDPHLRRFLNEIVMVEESDEIPGGDFLSHFELYVRAMEECHADVSGITKFIIDLSNGVSVRSAVQKPYVPDPARHFVLTTWGIIDSNSVHCVAASFTFGREVLTPDMFRNLIKRLSGQFPGKLDLLRYYLERHIDVDENEHAPLCYRMLERLCGDDPIKWKEAEDTARLSLEARKRLWDDLVAEWLAQASG